MRSVMIPVLVTAAGCLAACNAVTTKPGSFLSVTQECTAKQPRFVDAWGCIQARYASGEMGEVDPRLATFLKYGDDLAGEVAADKLSSAEAKKRLLQSAGNADHA